jgi:Cohesin domain
MVGRIILALTSFFLGTLAEASTSGATAVLIGDPPLAVLTVGAETANVGDVFTVPISIANVLGLTSFQFDLSFNPTVIKALSFTDIGTDFSTAASTGGGILTGITGFIDNMTGILSGVADSIGGLTTGPGLTPSGVIVDATFQALAVGNTPFTLSNAFLTDNGVSLSSANGNFMLQNGQATVLETTVPEPSSLIILLSFTLAGWGILRCRRRGEGD